jgi:hypothetical protein
MTEKLRMHSHTTRQAEGVGGEAGMEQAGSRRCHPALGALLFSSLLILASPGLAQNRDDAQQERQNANRDRCRNGVLMGGAAGAAFTRGNALNRLGGAAVGGAAGCVINRGGTRAGDVRRCGTEVTEASAASIRSPGSTAHRTLSTRTRLHPSRGT